VVRIFTDVYKNRDFAHAVIKFAGEVGAVAAGFYAEMGCDIIAIVDPVASQIKSATFKEFVTPNCQQAIKTIHDAGKTSSFFICGDCTKVLKDVCEIGTHGFAIDEQLNMVFVRDLARKYNVGFGGNLKLTLALSLGLPFAAGRRHREPRGRRPARIHVCAWVRHALRCSGGTYGSSHRGEGLVRSYYAKYPESW